MTDYWFNFPQRVRPWFPGSYLGRCATELTDCVLVTGGWSPVGVNDVLESSYGLEVLCSPNLYPSQLLRLCVWYVVYPLLSLKTSVP